MKQKQLYIFSKDTTMRNFSIRLIKFPETAIQVCQLFCLQWLHLSCSAFYGPFTFRKAKLYNDLIRDRKSVNCMKAFTRHIIKQVVLMVFILFTAFYFCFYINLCRVFKKSLYLCNLCFTNLSAFLRCLPCCVQWVHGSCSELMFSLPQR